MAHHEFVLKYIFSNKKCYQYRLDFLIYISYLQYQPPQAIHRWQEQAKADYNAEHNLNHDSKRRFSCFEDLIACVRYGNHSMCDHGNRIHGQLEQFTETVYRNLWINGVIDQIIPNLTAQCSNDYKQLEKTLNKLEQIHENAARCDKDHYA